MSGSVFLSLVSLHKPPYDDLPQGHITMMHRSAVAPLRMKAPCALCHEIGAYSAACMTAKSETKKCMMIGKTFIGFLHVFMLYPIPCLCGLCAPPFGKTTIFSSSAGMLQGTEPLQCLSFHTAACRHFHSLWLCCVAFWSTTMWSDLSHTLSTSSLKMIRRPWHPLVSMSCSSVFTLSSNDCLLVSILGRCLRAPIPRPASILHSRRATHASPFFNASSSCSPEIRCLSFSCLFLPRMG